MNLQEIKRQLGQLRSRNLYHLNGEDFAYFRPQDVAALVTEVERLTDTLTAVMASKAGEIQ